jgi:hypothetical protein
VVRPKVLHEVLLVGFVDLHWAMGTHEVVGRVVQGTPHVQIIEMFLLKMLSPSLLVTISLSAALIEIPGTHMVRKPIVSVRCTRASWRRSDRTHSGVVSLWRC